VDRSKIAIVIPAYNEIATIERVVRDVLSYGTPIVVDDASNDDTGSAAEAVGAYVIRHEVNRGYDGTLNSGFAAALKQGFDYVITIDADGQHSPDVMGRYVRLLEEGADLVVGVRPRKARLAETIFGWTTTFLYGIHDPLCGMKGYRMSLYREAGRFDSYNSIGTELTIFAAKHHYRICQIPVPINRRRNKSSRFGQVIRGNWLIFRALINGMTVT
jgi:glycosyltransferase involved in cell wall biosynthesis